MEDENAREDSVESRRTADNSQTGPRPTAPSKSRDVESSLSWLVAVVAIATSLQKLLEKWIADPGRVLALSFFLPIASLVAAIVGAFAAHRLKRKLVGWW